VLRVLALVALFAAAGCDAIPINLPDPKLGDGAASSDDSRPYAKPDGGGSPPADIAAFPDAPKQPWVDMGWGADAGGPVPLFDGGPCLNDGGDGGCPPSDAAPDFEAGVGEAGVDEGGTGPPDGTSNDCLFAD
jgi:hypothetical protein